MGSIETLIPGSPDSVDACARWMEMLRNDLSTTADETQRARSYSTDIWQGDAGDAYREVNKAVVRALESNARHVAHVHDLLLSYAQQLRLRQEDMSECRRRAAESGLVVEETLVLEPTPVVCPVRPDPGASLEQQRVYWTLAAAHDRYTAQVRTYLRLEVEVARILQRLNDWIEVNLHAAIREAASWAGAVGAGLTGAGFAVTGGESGLRARGEQLRQQVAASARAGARAASGNPAVRANAPGTQPRASSVVKRIAVHPMTGEVESLATVASRISHIGGIITVGASGLEIYQGASPSAVLVGAIGGVAGGTLGAQLGMAIGTSGLLANPAVAVASGAAVTIGLTISGGYVSRTLYTYSVPQHVRDLIDEGLNDTWNTFAHPDASHLVSDVPQGADLP